MEKSQELIGILQAISIVAKSLAAKLMQMRAYPPMDFMKRQGVHPVCNDEK